MPQINRVRVNNVKYNFGTQFYDDFVMRFNGKNTIYDLANGGGKSLLMLLLLQNMIPNCTLDEKQPIEKLFRAGGGNTVIHSLVEWKLDACYQKDNFKYMTTGFCARKGRSGDDDTESTDMQSAGKSAGGTASVEYFNYCIFYREFGDNDMKNLPLVSNGERITYNGLKTYLRDLEKNDFNVSVQIFDRKGDYQNFISQYGIFESAWEIVRGINKTEGHVRTYFETNYRTSRKVVEDLLIEEIIQKSFNNRLAVENDEGKMAQTLMDIKDKLVELSKKHAQMSAYDSQMAAVSDFAEYVKSFEELYGRKDRAEKLLFDMLLVCKRTVMEQEEQLRTSEVLLEKMKTEMTEENRSIATAEVISEQNSLDGMQDLIAETRKKQEVQLSALQALESRLKLTESAADYTDYKQYEKSLKELEETMNNRLRDHSDIVEELNQLAAGFYRIYHSQRSNQQDYLSVAESEYNRASTDLEEQRKMHREADQKMAKDAGLREYTATILKGQEAELSMKMENCEILVAENALDEAQELGATLEKLQSEQKKTILEFEEASRRLEKSKSTILGTRICLEMYQKEYAQLTERKENGDLEKPHMDKLLEVYNAESSVQLGQVILETYKRMDTECTELSGQIKGLERFIENAEAGTYSCDNPERDKLKKYLEYQYGEDVVDGHEWFRNLPLGQKRDVLKRTPFVEYSYVIQGDFERIKADTVLSNFERGTNVYPIVSEQILIDTKLEINKDLIVFAMKDMSFLRDDARCEAEIKLAKEELETLQSRFVKTRDRRDMVWEDYTFILTYQANFGNESIDKSMTELESQIASENRGIETEHENETRLESKCESLKVVIEQNKGQIEQNQKRIDNLNEIAQMHQEIKDKYAQLAQFDEELKEDQEAMSRISEEVLRLTQLSEQAAERTASARTALERLDQTWNLQFAQYYQEEKTSEEADCDSKETRAQDKDAAITEAILQMDADQLESRFMGLKAVLTQENSDFSDKEKLMNHYKLSMEKCRQAMEYRGTAFAEVEELVKKGEITECDGGQRLRLKQQIDSQRDALKATEEELEAQNALMNRLEGSIAHGINQLEEKFGAFEPFPCDNPESFMKQHKELVKKLSANLKNQESAMKAQAAVHKNTQVCQMDLERIVRDAGMEVPEHVNLEAVKDLDADISRYAETQKEYASILKLEFKKADEFRKHQQTLIDLLTGFHGEELAQEIRVSVRLPETITQTRQLVENLTETNTFIQLEKERVTKGIDDMERIKDNFENRCIQTCSNIKTELDRLPKLSNITLDGEQIAIISLVIPYVKEDLYKERMSAYIDETIVMAESFQSAEERLKYIRNRLTWKRLFSVIVTDMNAIRMNLYKRERIKDQSRYLRYEEAVGSTGQSQGIYIQFLIAIINYISNMNASSKETTLVGKTIFIDNPFGAAKDIYIWEPIFKMLATNHVQLIVPARGATPAITGRFDVNYILGQKLVDGRQQTVVVDYYSQTKETELEYTRMDYEQASFDFL